MTGQLLYTASPSRLRSCSCAARVMPKIASKLFSGLPASASVLSDARKASAPCPTCSMRLSCTHSSRSSARFCNPLSSEETRLLHSHSVSSCGQPSTPSMRSMRLRCRYLVFVVAVVVFVVVAVEVCHPAASHQRPTGQKYTRKTERQRAGDALTVSQFASCVACTHARTGGEGAGGSPALPCA